MNDPLLRLISSGLRLWIASRCDQVGELDLTLRGSSLALLQGRLEGADLKARQVRFDGSAPAVRRAQQWTDPTGSEPVEAWSDVGLARSFSGEGHRDAAG